MGQSTKGLTLFLLLVLALSGCGGGGEVVRHGKPRGRHRGGGQLHEGPPARPRLQRGQRPDRERDAGRLAL